MTEVAHYANLWRGGDRVAGDRLFRELETSLRQIAERRLAREGHHSLCAGDLVNEAVVRFAKVERIEWESRQHILAFASTLMRQILLDHARRKNADKRRHEAVTLCTRIADAEPEIELIALNQAMQELAEFDPGRAQIVEMRYFGGMSLPDIAAVIGVSEATVKRRWASTRAWLLDRLADQ
ncbi:MAG: RNA polymerase subunit sigma [Alphaproteobacteria bacterium HGW-Alphaproteobacteria-5]|nr:MAG: RNA polymerase subunit sigma [Alphaproteobacteria bacterium HGW-Alphaproteobacteria-5]